MDLDTDNFLAHYGVRGMKWGVRRSKRDKSRTVYSKAPAKLTDAELRRRLKRLEDEKRYNELNSRDVSQGEEFATKILKQVGSTTVATLLGAVALYGGKKAIGKVVGPDTLSEIFPKKKK